MEVGFGLVAESIDGSGVRLRRYRDEDVPEVRAACDDPLSQRFLHSLPSPYTLDDAHWWVNEGCHVAFQSGGGNFAIADPASDRLLGGIGITHFREGTGEIGYWVAPWGRRHGVATAATRTLSDYAFAVGYGRLQLRTAPENLASQRVALAAGYRWEGVQRAAEFRRDGVRHDLIAWVRALGDPSGPSPRILPDLPGGALTDGAVVLGPHDGPGAGADWLAGVRAALSVRDAGTGAVAGTVELVRVDPGLGQAEVRVLVDDEVRGARAVRALAGWAFDAVGLARLVAMVAPDDAAGQRVLDGAGFVREGYHRAQQPTPDGRRLDMLSYARLTAAGPG